MATYTAFVYTAQDETRWIDVWADFGGVREALVATLEAPYDNDAGVFDRALWLGGFRRRADDYWDVPEYPAYGDDTCTLTTKVIRNKPRLGQPTTTKGK